MKTLIKSQNQEAVIDTEGQVVIIGEKINPTGRKKLSRKLVEKDFDYIKKIADKQIEYGADILDINVGVPGEDEVAMLPEVVKVVSDHVDIPLCLDSPNPKALEAALKITPGRPLVNSVNGENETLKTILPLIKEYQVPVIGLTMDDGGIPMDADTRVKIAGKIIEEAGKLGIPTEDIVIDPLVLTVAADQDAGLVTLKTIREVRKEFGVNINLGASNVSFGLPNRKVVNQVFLALSTQMGASCMITDAKKLAMTIKATDLLLGRDEFARAYMKHYRATEKEKS